MKGKAFILFRWRNKFCGCGVSKTFLGVGLNPLGGFSRRAAYLNGVHRFGFVAIDIYKYLVLLHHLDRV